MTAPTPTITCETFASRLMDFLEGDLGGATRAAQESHAQHCAACGALLGDLERLSAQAPVLPTIRPSRDLWGGIAARIQAPVVSLPSRRPVWRSPAVVGTAVAATFVLAAVLGYETTHRDATVPQGAVAAVSPAQPAVRAARTPRTPAARLAAATPSAVEASYDAEIARLRAIVDTRRTQLDPKTLGVIDKNLKVIDDAIAACKTALARDSASSFLIQSLDQSLDHKVKCLRTMAMLPAGS